jgi:putative NADH-flavin reductase
MKILVIGATRGIGKSLVECALKENNEVSVLARNPDKIVTKHRLLNVIKGDILDSDTITRVVQEQEAVCSCVGVPITFKPVELFSRGAAHVIQAIRHNPGLRYIAVTGIGAGDSRGHGGFLYDRIFKPLFLKTIYADKDKEERLIKNSDTKWLIVRPAALTNGPRTGAYRVLHDLDGIKISRVSRLDVADYILKQLKNPSDFGKTPLLTY